MSTYQNTGKAADSNVTGKMSKMKESSRTPLRDRQKRPDKQLYVPRALRKTEVDITAEKDEHANTVGRQKAEASVIICHTYTKNIVNDTLLKTERYDIQTDKTHNSSDDISFIGQNNVSLLQTGVNAQNINDSALKSHSSVAITKAEEACEDINPCHNVARNYIFDDVSIDKKTIKHSDRMLPVDLKEKMTLESVKKSKSSIQSIELSNAIQSDFKDLPQCIDVKHVQDGVKTDISSDNPEDSWEAMFNDEGDCLDPKFVKELCDVTGRVELSVAKNDYSDYQPVSRNSVEEFEHIVELYGFPVEFSTQDLTSAFSAFQETSYNIKWVDDCHALAIFSSPVIANQALHLNHPFIKVRPLSEGIKESKEKAKFCARMFEARKPRPVTSAALARRLVSGALGLKVNASKEQREIERNMLREAKEKKKLKAKQRQDIWNGIVS